MPEDLQHEVDRARAAQSGYLPVLRRQRLVIVYGLLLTVAASFLASRFETPVYEAQSQVLVDELSPFPGGNVVFRGPYGRVQDEIQVLTSAIVKAAVEERLGFSAPVTAFQLGNTYVVNVRARSTDAEEAAAVSNAYVDAYIEHRRRQSVEDVLAASEALQARVDEVNRQLAQYDAEHPTPPGASSYAALNSAERNALVTQKALFEKTAQEIDIDVSLREGGPKLVSSATVPTEPVGPSRLEDILRAVGVGLLLGVAAAFLLDHLDDSVETAADVEWAGEDVSVVGLLPVVRGSKRGDRDIVSRVDPNSSPAEAYRSLRTFIQFVRLDRSLGILQVTSATASEGKTTVVANLAVALARAGERVAVVSCDLRRPRIHELFGVPGEIGFTSVLVREEQLSAALQLVPGEPNISVLASGPIPPNPSELLSAPRTADILTALKQQFDVVLLDCPPVLPVSDAAVLAARVDATLLVARAHQTTRRDLASAVARFRSLGVPLVGVVLNGATEESGYLGGDYYYAESRRSRRSRHDPNVVGSGARP